MGMMAPLMGGVSMTGPAMGAAGMSAGAAVPFLLPFMSALNAFGPKGVKGFLPHLQQSAQQQGMGRYGMQRQMPQPMVSPLSLGSAGQIPMIPNANPYGGGYSGGY